MQNKRGQISIEYVIVFGFVSFLIISVLGISLFYVDNIRDTIKFREIENYAKKITSSAEIVYYSGEPSKVTLDAYLPAGVESIEVAGTELYFTVLSSSGRAKLSYSSSVPLMADGNFLPSSEGLKVIQLTAMANSVSISST